MDLELWPTQQPLIMCENLKSPVCYHGNRIEEKWTGRSGFRLNMREEQGQRDESHHAAASSCEILSLPPACINNNM